MHPSSMENMQRCIDWYAPDGAARIVDLGAMDVNGSYRSLISDTCHYIGVDLEEGPGVDVVLEDVYQLPFADASADLVLSGQMLEHCGQFWRVFAEVKRVLKPGGLAFMIAPSAGPVHRYPVDCYRFYPDSFQALADWCGLRLIHCWTDDRGPWRDIVGVFQNGGTLQRIAGPRPAAAADDFVPPLHEDEAVERKAGRRSYLDVLQDLHQIIRPKLYLEIGVRRGRSLALAECPAIAIDPAPHPDFAISGPEISFHQCTSDDYFFFQEPQPDHAAVDLAFIDGMHLADYVLRDFMHTERIMNRRGVIVIDDVLPNHPVQAARERRSRVWTGDVWRFAEQLRERRPDLRLTWLDTAPTGLLLISGLNPKDRRLSDSYNKVMRQLQGDLNADVPDSILARCGAIDPVSEALRAAIGR